MDTIIFLDFETSGKDPNTCLPLQLSAVAIDGRRFEMLEDGLFNEYMRPPISDEEIADPFIIPDDALAINHIKREDIKDFPAEKIVWDNFARFVDQYRGNTKGLCIPAGWNYIGYDKIIIDRLRVSYPTTKRFFHENNYIDIMNIDWLFRGDDPEYTGKSFLGARRHYGIDLDDDEKAHDSRVDVKYGAQLLMRYLKWMKEAAKKKKYFRGAFLAKNTTQ